MILKSFVATITLGFIATANAQNFCRVGAEQWVAGCEARCTASWGGSDCPRSCTATAPVGHVIMNHRVHQHSVNNGGGDASRMASGQTFDYKRRVEIAYQNALEAAGRAGNKSAEGRIKEDMRQAIAEAEAFSSSHQMVRLQVSASKHGHQFDRKRGWSHMSVELLVKCVTPPNLEDQLYRKYALQ